MTQSSDGGGGVAPRPKVAAAGIAGAITTIVIWILNSLLGVEVPPEVAAAITTVLAFLAGYFTPQSSG
jgi:putative flippase GtrA